MVCLTDNRTISQTTTCCAHTARKNDPMQETLLFVLEKVSLVGLGILSAYISPELFVPFFIAGGAYGVYSHFQEKNGQAARIGPSCTQGVLEQLTGVKMPAAVALVANVAITAGHAVHLGVIFVPIIALWIGASVGKSACECGSWLYREITVLSSSMKPSKV